MVRDGIDNIREPVLEKGVEIQVLNNIAAVFHVVFVPELFEFVPIIPDGYMRGVVPNGETGGNQGLFGLHLVAPPRVRGVFLEVNLRGNHLQELDIGNIEVVHGVAVIAHEDAAVGAGECGPDLAETAHVVQMLPVLALDRSDALGFDADNALKVNLRQALADNDDGMLFLEMLLPPGDGVVQLAALRGAGKVWYHYQIRRLPLRSLAFGFLFVTHNQMLLVIKQYPYSIGLEQYPPPTVVPAAAEAQVFRLTHPRLLARPAGRLCSAKGAAAARAGRSSSVPATAGR